MANGILKVGEITTSSGSGNITIGSGVTLLSNTPAFEAYLSTEETVSSNNTYEVIPFNIEVVDTDNAYSTSTYRFTVPTGGDGLYWFHLHMGIVNITTGGGNAYPQMVGMRGGTTLFSIYSYWSHSHTASYGTAHISRIHKLEAGDYVYVGMSTTNAEYYDNPSELNFQGFLIG